MVCWPVGEGWCWATRASPRSQPHRNAMLLSSGSGRWTGTFVRGRDQGRFVGSDQHVLWGLNFVVIHLLNYVQLFATPWTVACQASLSFTISWSLIKLMSIELVMPSNHLILLFLLPSIFTSIRVFSNELALRIKWPKYWSCSFSISPSNKYSGLISFGIDWFDLLAVQGTLKSLLQYHSSKASILQRAAFFMVSHIHTWLWEKS